MQIGAEIRVSLADVDSDPLLSQYWPPNTSIRHGSCSKNDFAIMDYKTQTQTQKYGRTHRESVKSVVLGQVWPPLLIVTLLFFCGSQFLK